MTEEENEGFEIVEIDNIDYDLEKSIVEDDDEFFFDDEDDDSNDLYEDLDNWNSSIRWDED